MSRLRPVAISIVVAVVLLSLAVESDSRAAPPVAPADYPEAVAVSAAPQSDPAQPAQIPSGATGGGDSRSGASTSNQQGCLPTSELPPALASLASVPDCATGAVGLDSGDAVAGTVEGNLVVARASGTDTYPSNGTGPVTSLTAVRIKSPVDPAVSLGQVVTYAVEEGVGVFDPRVGSNIMFGGHALFDKGYNPVDPARYFFRGQIILMVPVQGRPRLNSVGQWTLTKPDGQDEALILSLGGGSACGRYLTSPDALPEQRWCTDISDDLPPGASLPPVPPPLVLPGTGGGCGAAATIQADADHTINVVIGRDTIAPSAITITAGEQYVVTLASSDPRVSHYLLFVDSSGRAIRDANGAIVCVAAPQGTEVMSTDFIAPDFAGPAYLEDPIHPNQRVAVTIDEPPVVAVTLSPDVASLTPVTTPSPPPTPIQARSDRSPTPAPVRAPTVAASAP